VDVVHDLTIAQASVAVLAARARPANVVRSRISIVASRTSSQTGLSDESTSGGEGSGLRRVA
jgi:hypothetical protein